MTTIKLYPEVSIIDFSQIFILLAILFAEYFLVLIATIADLISGVRKAKKRGELRSSIGFRRTFDKLGRYFLVIGTLTVLDIMQILGVWYLTHFYGYSIPLFPVLTFLGSLGAGMIEVKSIYEKAEDKVKYDRVGKLAGDIIRNREDAEAIMASVAKYLKNDDAKDENK